MSTPYVIGIAGGSGSGKTTLIELLQTELGSDCVCLVSQDDYYHPIDKQQKDGNGKVNFDLPGAINSEQLTADVEALRAGEAISIERYTFNNPNDKGEERSIEPKPIIVVEGLFVFHFTAMASVLDMKIFVEANANTRLSRRLSRDMKERGYPEHTVRYQWEHHVEPAYLEYLAPYRNHVDVCLDNEHDMRLKIPALLDLIRHRASLTVGTARH